MQKVNILGTDYKIYFDKNSEFLDKYNCDGFCDKTTKEIHIRIMTDDNCELFDPKQHERKVLRHEIIHAFFIESGWNECMVWDNPKSMHSEQVVDWIAYQYPKIHKVFKQLGIEE